MEIKEIQKKDIWENFLSGCQEKTFLSSWNWGEFQTKMGNKIWRLGIYDKEQITNNSEQLIAVALVSKITARRGTFLLIQHGPNIKNSNSKNEILKMLLEKLKQIAREEKADFIRMNPLWERNQENQNILRDSGFREAPMHANAYEATWKLDITPTEEELLGKMRKTTRYLIRQAMKNQDITIEKSGEPDEIKTYQKLNREVAERQRFVPFSSEYIKNEFEVFAKDGEILLFLGKYKNEVVSAALVVFGSGVGFYHQAASSSKYAKLSIPYLLLWEAIKEAKNRRCDLFDFWGYVNPEKEPKHPWSGPTLFKMGFGGNAFEYAKTQDFPLSKKYLLTYIFEKLRKIKRGL